VGTRSAVVGEPKVFDYPGRSLRGRTITHAICVRLQGDHALPHCKGADDAEKAVWMPIGDIYRMEEEFFEDHFSIINFWLHRIQ
jgi:bifunctional NMN adenylyltransferase/nudix hydrolase